MSLDFGKLRQNKAAGLPKTLSDLSCSLIEKLLTRAFDPLKLNPLQHWIAS